MNFLFRCVAGPRFLCCFQRGNRFFPPKFCFVQFGVGQFRTIFPVWKTDGEGASTTTNSANSTPTGNASGLNDGAALCLLMSAAKAGGSFPRRWFQRFFYVSSRKFGEIVPSRKIGENDPIFSSIFFQMG